MTDDVYGGEVTLNNDRLIPSETLDSKTVLEYHTNDSRAQWEWEGIS